MFGDACKILDRIWPWIDRVVASLPRVSGQSTAHNINEVIVFDQLDMHVLLMDF